VCSTELLVVVQFILSDREQYIEVNNVKSDIGKITCGVPQGSILGPLLFTVYVNDIKQTLTCDL